MRTETIKIYNFNELSDKAKSKAIMDYLYRGAAWLWQDEWWQSAVAFCEIAPIDIREADYDRAHVSYSWTGDDDVADLSGVRAWKWLQNNGWFDLARKNAKGGCTLTGYCGDCPLFDPIAAVERSPSKVPELSRLFYECLQSWVYEARSDMEYCYSDDAASEYFENSCLEFQDDGTIH
jgi:hypothetical protein